MDQRAQNAKKRDNFKKQIRKDQLQQKRVEVRRVLPYYEPMFNKSDDDSNGTNSRSSRFPVPGKNSKEFRSSKEQNDGQINENESQWTSVRENEEKQCQQRYIKYLSNLKNESEEERKEKINTQIKNKHGDNCFNFMDGLRDQICIDLMNCEKELMGSESENALEELNWGYILAAFYLAENQNYPEIHQLCFGLITKYFIAWYQANIKSKMIENMSISDFLNVLDQQEEDKIKIEEVILSNYISLKNEQEIDQESMRKILGYYGQKIEMFLQLERHLDTQYPNEEVEFFSEILFDFPSLFLVETLLEMISKKETSTEMKMSVFMLLNRYYSGYPYQVASETETQQKFKNFISKYMKKLCTFLKFCFNGNQNCQIDPTLYELIHFSLKLLSSLSWREQSDEELLINMMDLYQTIVNLVLETNIVKEIVQFVDFHAQMLDFFMMLYDFMEPVEELFETSRMFNYFSTLVFEWHSFKFENIQQGTLILENKQSATPFMKFEFYLIQCIYLTKKTTSEMQFKTQDKQYIESIFDYADFAYTKERSQLFDLRKKNYGEMAEKELFLFEENIGYYFKLFKNQKEQVFNPETHEQCSEQDVEI